MHRPALPLLAALVFSPRAALAQEVPHSAALAAALSVEALDAPSRRAEELRRVAPDAPAHRRVAAACELAGLALDVASRVRVAASAGVLPEPAAAALWHRRFGATLAATDPEASALACLALARSLHVRSEAVQVYRARFDPRQERPLLLPAVGPEVYDDRDGERTVAAYADAARAVAARPDDGPARVRLAALQALTDDPAAARATLRDVADGVPGARLTRAVAAWRARDDATALPAIEALARRDGDARAAFDLARVARFAADAREDPAVRRRRSFVSAAAWRVFFCGADGLGPLPRDALRDAAEEACEARTLIEDPNITYGGCGVATMLPLAELPAAVRALAPRLPEDVSTPCARARAALDAACVGRPVAPHPALPPLRALTPEVTSVAGARPVFAWLGAPRATWERCADRACARVLERADVATPFRPPRDLPAGLSFWRVRAGTLASPPRALWVDPRATGHRGLPDVDGDGWPDVPLGDAGAYARVDAAQRATLVPLPPDDGRRAPIAFAGDLDADGFGDFVQSSALGAGVLRGSPGGLRPSAFLAGEDVWSAAEPFADVDRDGAPDLYLSNAHQVRDARGAVRLFPYDGSGVVALAGDVDDDGFDEVASGTYDSVTYRGTWRWWRLPVTGPDARPLREVDLAAWSGLGFRVGDLDGDGREDFALVHHIPQSYPQRVRVDVIATRAARRPEAIEAAGQWPRLWPAGDVDGDGHADVLMQLDRALTVHLGDGAARFPRRRALAATTSRTPLAVTPGVGASPAPLWVFLDGPLRAIRVTAGAEETMLLGAP
ncbi:MAG: VCBS repeat-containing protein [Polyangiales bacterium]